MTTPKNDGFYMPAEFAPHRGTIMIFPERPGSWPHNAEPAARVFVNIIKAIARDEEVFVAVSERTREKAKKMLDGTENVTFFEIEQDDAWARDIAPTFVTNGSEVRGVDWCFNAWGGSFDGLYAHWERDDAFAAAFCEKAGYRCYNAKHFVLEGGAVHSDGEGTLLVTEACLLSRGRNPDMTRAEIEKNLCEYLGAEKVIWLPRGIYNDETNEHIDNVCAFIAPAEVVLAWTDDKSDPQYPLSAACLDVLAAQTDAAGRKIRVHKLPIPAVPVCVTADDMQGYVFEAGEDTREIGERLAASYVNFYFTNNAVILPQFGGENAASDRLAVSVAEKICRGRRIVPIQARDIIVGGGNIHCITQQIPFVGGKK